MSSPFEEIDAEGVAFGQIPCVSAQAASDAVDDSRRTEDLEGGRPVEKKPQEGVESDKVVDVSMGNKDRRDLQRVSMRKAVNLAAVEEEGFPAVCDAHIERRVTVGAVDKSGEKCRSHPWSEGLLMTLFSLEDRIKRAFSPYDKDTERFLLFDVLNRFVEIGGGGDFSRIDFNDQVAGAQFRP